MTFQFTASDLGFVVNSEKVNSEEKINFDGFEFPKYIPNPIYKDEGDLYYTSDQVEDSAIIQSLLPSHNTPNHCIVIPSSQIPPANSFRSQNTSDADRLQYDLERLNGILKRYQTEKNRQIETSGQGSEELEEKINDCYNQIIQIQLALHSNNNERTNPSKPYSAYIQEINAFVAHLQNLTEHVYNPSIPGDIDQLMHCLEDYLLNTCHESEMQLKKTYHAIRSKYSFVCWSIPLILYRAISLFHKKCRILSNFLRFKESKEMVLSTALQIQISTHRLSLGMDADMCLKMLAMYLETIDTDLRDVVLKHQDKLFSQINDIKEMKTQYEVINSRVESITKSFNSIKSEVNLSCQKINENALRLANYNSVLSLLRQITAFRLGIKKIKGLLSENPSPRAWLRAQKTYQEIEKIYIDGHLGNVNFLSEDVRYYNEVRMQIIKNTNKK